MSDNFNEQFDEWQNRDEKQDDAEFINEWEHSTSDAAEVSNFTETRNENAEQEKTDSEFDNPETGVSAREKTSFTELRQKRKIPRLKKSMILAIITGGTFVFLFMVNMIVQKKEERKRYFDEDRNGVSIGSDFSLGDLEKRTRQFDDEMGGITESEEKYWKSPPAYTPVGAHRDASFVPATGDYAVPNIGSYYSDSDILAIKARIGKEGGYGSELRTVSYNPGDYNSTDYNPMNPMNASWQPIISREEYSRQRIDDIAQLTQAAGGGQLNADRANNGRFSDAGRYNPNNTQAGSGLSYLTDTHLFPGTIIHAILVSRIDTDYPGPIHARVTENVYDSMSGKNLLIPQGTILQGNYSSSSIGVSKVQIAWESMVVNYNGVAYQVSLGGMAGVDKRGRAGIAGTLDDHYFEWLKAAGIVSLFTMLNSEVAYQSKGQNNPQIRELMDINQGLVNRLGERIMERALNIQPTVRVANGTAVSVSVNAPLNLRPFPAIKTEEKYVRR